MPTSSGLFRLGGASFKLSNPCGGGRRVPKLKTCRLRRLEPVADGVTRDRSDGAEHQRSDQNGADGSRAGKQQKNPGNDFQATNDHGGALSEPCHGEQIQHEFHARELRVTGCEKQNTDEYLKGVERDDRHAVPDDRAGRALCNDRL